MFLRARENTALGKRGYISWDYDIVNRWKLRNMMKVNTPPSRIGTPSSQQDGVRLFLVCDCQQSRNVAIGQERLPRCESIFLDEQQSRRKGVRSAIHKDDALLL